MFMTYVMVISVVVIYAGQPPQLLNLVSEPPRQRPVPQLRDRQRLADTQGGA
jgi:hypothetical protein